MPLAWSHFQAVKIALWFTLLKICFVNLDSNVIYSHKIRIQGKKWEGQRHHLPNLYFVSTFDCLQHHIYKKSLICPSFYHQIFYILIIIPFFGSLHFVCCTSWNIGFCVCAVNRGDTVGTLDCRITASKTVWMISPFKFTVYIFCFSNVGRGICWKDWKFTFCLWFISWHLPYIIGVIHFTSWSIHITSLCYTFSPRRKLM